VSLIVARKGERIALGNIKSKNVEEYVTIAEIKKKTVPEMKGHNDKHFANDFINKRWKDREHLYALVLRDVEREPNPYRYLPSHGNPKVRLKES
jgi:hypothetical protein